MNNAKEFNVEKFLDVAVKKKLEKGFVQEREYIVSISPDNPKRYWVTTSLVDEAIFFLIDNNKGDYKKLFIAKRYDRKQQAQDACDELNKAHELKEGE